jgi:hypothetical protein
MMRQLPPEKIMSKELKRTLFLEQAITGEKMRQVELGIMMAEVELMRLKVLGLQTQELTLRPFPEYVIGQLSFHLN